MGDDLGQASAPRRHFTNLLRLDETASTNLICAEAARDGAAEGLVVVARRQSQGRGRRGRRWVAAPEGALLCSVLMRPPLALTDVWSSATALALSALAAARSLAPCEIALKWPNDLVAPGGKVAGVLAELIESDPPAVVVGIGMNLYWPEGWAPEGQLVELLEGASSLEAESGVRVEPEQFLDELLSALEDRYQAVCDGGGAGVLEEYRASCATIGRRVRVERDSTPLLGTALGIASNGALELDLDGRVVAVEIGDVVHLRDR